MINKKYRLALLTLVLAFAVLPHMAGASIPTNPLCAGGLTPGLINPNNIIFAGHSAAAQSLLTISLLILLLMLFISGISYAIGYAFRLDRLLRFSRNEIGEVFVTALIVLIFIGTFSVASVGIGAQNLFAVAGNSFNDNIFIADCSLLAQNSFSLIGPLITEGSIMLLQSFVGSLSISIAPNFFGIAGFSPLYGLNALVPIINLLIYTASGLMAILLGTTVFISIIYSLFPLFLYLGIVLRTLPWTRAAGGAFLGLFIAFYVVFPLLIYATIIDYIPYLGTPSLSIQSSGQQVTSVNAGSVVTITATCLGNTQSTASTDLCQILIDGSGAGTANYGSETYQYTASSTGCRSIEAIDLNSERYTSQTLEVDPTQSCQTSSSYGQITGSLSGLSGSFNPASASAILTSGFVTSQNPYSQQGLINGFIFSVLEPVIYIVFSIALALIISFDFMEALGDMLGAPSLRSSNMLKRIL